MSIEALMNEHCTISGGAHASIGKAGCNFTIGGVFEQVALDEAGIDRSAFILGYRHGMGKAGSGQAFGSGK